MLINRDPDWVTRGKLVGGLIRELATFENKSLIVNISLDDSRSVNEIIAVLYVENKCILLGGLEDDAALDLCLAHSLSEKMAELLYSGTCSIQRLIEILNQIEIIDSKVVISNGLINKEISLIGKGGSGKFCLLKNCESPLKVVK